MDDLIGRWVAGDSRAAGELYRLYYDRVRRFAVRLGRTAADAEDIAQEALLAGLDGLKGGKRPDRITFWLLGIARHLSYRKPRTAVSGLSKVIDRNRLGARTQAVRREMGKLLEDSMDTLPASSREVLELHHHQNLSRKEIAERLGLSPDAVHARFERGYARLRESLSRHFTTVTLAPRPVGLSEVEKLRPAFRDAVTARHVEGLSETEAAARLGIPVATLRARLESAYETLGCGTSGDFTPARDERRRRP